MKMLVITGVIIVTLCSQLEAIPSISIDDVGFYLFTPKNPTEGQKLKINDTDLLDDSNFNFNWPIRIIIHGYESSKDSYINIAIRNEYFKKGNFNVISVDWSYYSHTLYPIAMDQVTPVGTFVGELTKFLNRQGASYDKMYLIGHSLGAHIAGVAGNHISPELYNTIFALDPARPGFEGMALERKIDRNDAWYVESIQTNTFLFGVGMVEPVGDAAFYPNHLDPIQPGCDEISCSHTRSIDYFVESINSDVGFLAKACSACSEYVRMGGEPSTPKEGIFDLSTNAEPPFARGKYGA
ncbi:pancreatic lipase-related protein 2-like isoform X2 [Hermetia illucens]|uniref:pancreatic lipase-related protein 2-like isoform X2 n=1 Tax=Hermetia illucens TaxID=343691 RepID=UPI0018CC1A98|nr:pancreatic lipase-related protein 2-like isoform X2 [Hermetia illucens]